MDPDAIRDAIKDLSKGALAVLVSSKPMTSGTEMNHDTTYPTSPLQKPSALPQKLQMRFCF